MVVSVFDVDGDKLKFFSVANFAESIDYNHDYLPRSLKILVENSLRNGANAELTKCFFNRKKVDIGFYPARVLVQDFTGVPAVADLAAMRNAAADLGIDPEEINPKIPVDLVIDHSVQVHEFGNKNALLNNTEIEIQQNTERYGFLRWGQEVLKNFRIVPPGTGICHQVNLEYLAQIVRISDDGTAYPDTLVGLDSHTTMINGLSVLGWGVGGIEAESAMLGRPISMQIPDVVGVKLLNETREGITATDVVLTITQMLRAKGVVGKFVEFYGPGLNCLSLADRATIANMAPEYGATCGFFPIDEKTLEYLELTNRGERISLVEAYAKAQGLWNDDSEMQFDDTLCIDLANIEASVAGPKRPQDRVILSNVHENFSLQFNARGDINELSNGSVVVAAITSCTNTSNPDVMIAAGLLARNAYKRGLRVKSWVKTSLAPGSKVVTEYLEASGLQEYLNYLNFDTVGYGCTTCIGNSGPLIPEIEKEIIEKDLDCVSVLSGNRNFEGRVHPLTKANYLASPPLVVAYALTGSVKINLKSDALGNDRDGNEVFLKDIWPSDEEIKKFVHEYVNKDMFSTKYSDVFSGDENWQKLPLVRDSIYDWSNDDTYIKHPPFFHQEFAFDANPIKNAKILALLGDSITTDHISPAGAIAKSSPAAQYLRDNGVASEDFNSYGSRRGNHEVMMRGTFANIRIRNEMVSGVEGGYTVFNNQQMSIYDAAMQYKKSNTNLIVVAGKEYGTGSSRDWAAKGTRLLGVKIVLAESFERIHRSNLVGMGIIPLQFIDGENRKTWNLTGQEEISLNDVSQLNVGESVSIAVKYQNNDVHVFKCIVRLDTEDEVRYLKSGGILRYVLDEIVA